MLFYDLVYLLPNSIHVKTVFPFGLSQKRKIYINYYLCILLLLNPFHLSFGI